MLGELKGIGRVALSCRVGGHQFELMTYADESWAICRDGRVIDRFASNVEPSAPHLVGAIEQELARAAV